MFITKEISVKTKKPFDIIDITDLVSQFVKENKLEIWLLNVFTRHTTAILKINEVEDWFWKDMENRCQKNISINEFYHHNDLENRDPKTMCDSKEECLNWHSHIRAMLFGVSSETIPVKNNELMLGTRQRILFIEMDHARDRKIILSFVG